MENSEIPVAHPADRAADLATGADPAYELRAALDVGFCGNRSHPTASLDDEFPPAVCTLPAGHDGMHNDGRCSWEYLGGRP